MSSSEALVDSQIETICKYFFELGDYKFTNIHEDKTAVKALYKIFNFAHSAKKISYVGLGLKYDFSNSLCKILNSNFESLSKALINENNVDQLNDILKVSKYCIGIIRNFSNCSSNFCKNFQEVDGTSFIFKYLKHKAFIEKYISAEEGSDNLQQLNRIIRGALGSLLNLTKSFENFKQNWQKEDAVGHILYLSEVLKTKFDCKLVCNLILVSIADEDEIKQFPGIINVLPVLTGLIASMAQTLASKEGLERVEVQMNEDIVEICKKNVNGTSWHLVELLKALYNMAVNDKIKHSIYFDFNMKEHLKLIVSNGNDIEKEYALKMLWQLCFDERISTDVYNDKEFFATLEGLLKSHEKVDRLVKNTNGIIWLINTRLLETTSDEQIVSSNKHVMISYNRDSRDLCLKIKEELEKDGHSVWIDVEDIHGSSLESMAHAIENSKCVLMCMTEKYKQSSNCRAEAEYAFQLNKQIIPLIMQTKYKPDGWLGIILGAKVFIDYTKYDFVECLRRTCHELKNLEVPKIQNQNQTQKALASNKNIQSNQVLEWTESQVEKWFKEKNFNRVIMGNVLPCNGQLLNQFHQMLVDAPEFFYSSISSNKSIPTRDVALFALEIKNLFGKN